MVILAILYVAPASVRWKALWAATKRADYLVGVLQAADQARLEGVGEIAAIEFGVGHGRGLVYLQKHARAVERATGVRIQVYGFDTGKGLPVPTGDYRDAPDRWQQGDYPMDEAALRARLDERSHLIIGDVKDTVPAFVADTANPTVGFVAVDVDYYSSAASALKLFSLPGKRMLMHVPMYFDDVARYWVHRDAGEFLAIREFNEANANVKIDEWHGLKIGRPFQERQYWLSQMYMAHDLDAISAYKRPERVPNREVGRI